MNKTYEIGPTEDRHRRKAPYDFVVAIAPELAEELELKGFVAVIRTLKDEDGAPLADRKEPLRVYGIVSIDPALKPHQVRMDQTLRNALGIRYEDKIHTRSDVALCPIVITLRQRFLGWITRLLGRRYLFLRVAKPHPPDIEKDICRVPTDALALMGTGEGNKIVLVACKPASGSDSAYVLKNYSIRAFDLDSNMAARRDQEEHQGAADGWGARYVDPSTLFRVSPDIGRIFLDEHARAAVGVVPGDPIKVRRNFPDLFKRQLLEVGILLTISAIALTRLLPEDWRSDHYPLYLGVSLAISLVVTVAVIFLRLRARVQ